MKRTMMVLALCAAFIWQGDVQAKRITADVKPHDATWLASEDVMTSNIGRARSAIPLGTIVAWPHNGGFPSDVADDWAECDGRAIPTTSDAYRQLGISRTPNLYVGMGTAGKGYFLRAGATAQQVRADKFESHKHGQPEHTHMWNGQLASTQVAGKAEGQQYTVPRTWFGGGGQLIPVGGGGVTDGQGSHSHSVSVSTPEGGGYGSTSSAGLHSHKVTWDGYGNLGIEEFAQRTAMDSDVNAHVVDGTVLGTVASSGGDDTFHTGEDETAPTYYSTRYFMRINE